MLAALSIRGFRPTRLRRGDWSSLPHITLRREGKGKEQNEIVELPENGGPHVGYVMVVKCMQRCGGTRRSAQLGIWQTIHWDGQ